LRGWFGGSRIAKKGIREKKKKKGRASEPLLTNPTTPEKKGKKIFASVSSHVEREFKRRKEKKRKRESGDVILPLSEKEIVILCHWSGLGGKKEESEEGGQRGGERKEEGGNKNLFFIGAGEGERRGKWSSPSMRSG